MAIDGAGELVLLPPDREHERLDLEEGVEILESQLAARRLIPVKDLGEPLAWAYDLAEAADELWVDVGTIRTRLEHLHPSERAYLKRRLADQQDEEEATA